MWSLKKKPFFKDRVWFRGPPPPPGLAKDHTFQMIFFWQSSLREFNMKYEKIHKHFEIHIKMRRNSSGSSLPTIVSESPFWISDDWAIPDNSSHIDSKTNSIQLCPISCQNFSCFIEKNYIRSFQEARVCGQNEKSFNLELFQLIWSCE